MAGLYQGTLGVFIVVSIITGVYVLLKRNMPGSKIGGVLILLSAAWSTAYTHQLGMVFSEDILQRARVYVIVNNKYAFTQIFHRVSYLKPYTQ